MRQSARRLDKEDETKKFQKSNAENIKNKMIELNWAKDMSDFDQSD